MTSAVVRVPFDDLKDGVIDLDPATSHYVTRVLRLRAGDPFVAFDPRAAMEGDGVIVHEGRVKIGALRSASVIAPRAIAWVQAIAKGDKCDAIVRDVTELGGTSFRAVLTERSIVKLDEDRAEGRRARWDRIAREACRQCGRGDGVAIANIAMTWSAAMNETHADARFVLYERATLPLGPALGQALASNASLAFAAGPEGGFTDEEIQLARDAGWTIASLGRSILRAETVAAAVLGAVRVFS
jgi:16S rRNA (uracil1498-N3)-methyltransferase